jgi:hypothetical protein
MVDFLLNNAKEQNKALYTTQEENEEWKDFIKVQKGLVEQIIS